MKKLQGLIPIVLVIILYITIDSIAQTGNCVEYNIGNQTQQTCILSTPTVPGPTGTPVPTLIPTIAPTPTPIEPYAGAPACPEELHNRELWHDLWNAAAGCHYTHEHHANPHVLDNVFGTEIYNAMGDREISHPWQTFSGALDQFEQPNTGSCLENDCKHEGYKWLVVLNRGCQNTPYVMNGANNCIINARVLAHMIFSEVDAVVRFHSVVVQAEVCNFGGINCGTFHGGGHLDMGKLNIPRGTYVPIGVNHEPSDWMTENAETQPYKIHGHPGTNVLDSWQSEGNQYNYTEADPDGSYRLRVGFAVHVNDAWGGVNIQDPDVVLDCPDFQCSNNNSEAALFRVWVIIPEPLDGSEYDEDGEVNGYFTSQGYTNRYGDIVEDCTAVSLDCVPYNAQAVPVKKSRFRGEFNTTNVEYDTSPFWEDGTRDWWIEYPN